MSKINNLHTLNSADKLALIVELWDSVLDDQINIENMSKAQIKKQARLHLHYELYKNFDDSWEIIKKSINNKNPAVNNASKSLDFVT